MKKIIALLLSVVLMLSAAVPAFAAYETPFEDSLFFEYEDYSIHYRVWEAENAKGQIFMIHGFALSSYCWTELAKRLVEGGYTCVMADLPDFGYSTRETSATEKLPREDIMHALMVSLSDEPWYVAGHSMGGYVAQALYAKYPESVVNLLLYGTGTNDTDPASAAIMGNPVFASVMGTFMQMMTKLDVLVRLFLVMALNDASYAASYDLSKVTDPIRIEGTGKGACYSFSMLTPTDYDALANGKPILFVSGGADSVIPDASKNALRAVLPEGSVDYVVDGGGHLFIENKADETAKVTLDFLAENK